MSENVRFWGTIVLLELKKSCVKACLRLWLGDSLFALHGSGCGYENASYHSGFPLWVFVHCSLVPASLYALMTRVPGAEPPHWLFHLSCRLPHCVLPFLPSQSIPLCVHLCPLTNHSGQMLFLCCCQSKRRYDFVFSSFDNCIAFNTHSLFTVGPHLGVFISV